MSRVLIIGDTHIPFIRQNYLTFIKDLKKEYRTDITIHIGDVCDLHSISFHEHNPELSNALEEYQLAFEMVKEWKAAFPKMLVCIGNHDARITRVAQSVNIPSQMLRSFNELWGTPEWDWQWEYVIDNVRYLHGNSMGTGSLHPAFNAMRGSAMSTVAGDHHSCSGVKWLVNTHARLFGMDVGAGCDDRTLAFAYAKFNQKRSVISAAVVIDGMPYLELMPMSKGEKYWDRKSAEECRRKGRRKK